MRFRCVGCFVLLILAFGDTRLPPAGIALT